MAFREENMDELKLDRRTWLKAATALAATGLASGMGCAQTGPGLGPLMAKSCPVAANISYVAPPS